MRAKIELQHPDMDEFSPRSHVRISDASISEDAVIHAIATMMGRIVNPDFYSPTQEIFAREPLRISHGTESLKDGGIWIVSRQVRDGSSLSRYANEEGYLECGTIELSLSKGNRRGFLIEFYVGQERNQPLNCSDWARTFEKEVGKGELDKLIRSETNPEPKPK